MCLEGFAFQYLGKKWKVWKCKKKCAICFSENLEINSWLRQKWPYPLWDLGLCWDGPFRTAKNASHYSNSKQFVPKFIGPDLKGFRNSKQTNNNSGLLSPVYSRGVRRRADTVRYCLFSLLLLCSRLIRVLRLLIIPNIYWCTPAQSEQLLRMANAVV